MKPTVPPAPRQAPTARVRPDAPVRPAARQDALRPALAPVPAARCGRVFEGWARATLVPGAASLTSTARRAGGTARVSAGEGAR
jgi:hypothetical protein